MTEYVIGFDALGKNDAPTAGGKGANLGEMTAAGLPVPPGFVVAADAYLVSMGQNGIRAEIDTEVRNVLTHADQPEELAAASKHLQALVRDAGVHPDVLAAVLREYQTLGDDVAVAVRSSATSEDTAGASFAGMNET